MLEDQNVWPEDILWIRQAFLKDWKRWTSKDQSLFSFTPAYAERALTFSPRFFVAQDGVLLESVPSRLGWDHYIQPLLTKLVGA